MKHLNKLTLMTAFMTAGIIWYASMSAFRAQSFYWVIYGLLELGFWAASFYPNYNWRDLNTYQKVLASCFLSLFCIYFLPPDILLSEFVDHLRTVLGMGMVTAVVLGIRDDDDDDNDGEKEPLEEEGSEDWGYCLGNNHT